LVGILDYLDEHWPSTVSLSFLYTLEASIVLITNHPEQFPEINQNLLIRKCVLTKHNSLYYRVLKDRLEVLRIYDNRQNPRNLRFVK